MGVFLWRVIGAARLQRSVFEEVAADPVASIYAVFLIFLVGWSAYLGRLASQEVPLTVTLVLGGVLAGFPAMAGCWITTFLVYCIGIRSRHGPSTPVVVGAMPSALTVTGEPRPDMGAVFRVVCFVQAPNLFGFLAGMPYVGIVIAVGLGVWSFFVWFAGLGALGIPTMRALVVWVINLALLWTLQGLVTTI